MAFACGCDTGASTKIEKPTNPTPPPTKEALLSGQQAPGGAGTVASPKMKPLPLPKKK